ncbi:MAG: DUF885 domain-containing protein [Gemmataceae bacterium]|nr:DUF885 domain-containing protein [Gemmataceae bacterium]MCI0739298.1 DUF885 domain-containing protein [Gemmataceae bacterium]
MRKALAIMAVLAIVNPLAESAGGQVEDAKLATFFKSFLDEEFKHRPLEATRLGDHRFDHLLDDVSPEARANHKARLQKTHDELPQRIDYKKLTRSGQIDFEILQHHLKKELWLMDNTRVFEEDPRVYNDYITESVYLLLTQSTLPQATNVKNAAARMAFIPRVVEAAKAGLKAAPRVVVETAIKQNRGAISFFQTGIFELAGETPALSALRDASKPVIAALKDYQKFLEEELLPRAKGEWRLGKEKFAQKLKLELNSGIEADEVLKEAEAEADRVELEMFVIARQLWATIFPGRTLPPDSPEGRRQTVLLVMDEISKEHGRPEDLVKDARATADKVRAFIKAKDILKLPDPDRCRIIEMPEFQRGNSIAYLNPAPPLDPKASSYYAISPPPSEWEPRRAKTYLQEYNRHMMHILTIHEAYPGHYVQLEYSNRHPSLIRRVLYSGVFAEGWAVYTEHVMLDQGYGDGDLKLRLCQLKWYLRTVCNAILDYKMHCTDMSDEEALRFLMFRAFQSEAEAILKIIRAKQSSCQLSTYFVGRMAFVRLRRRVQAELGERFELGRFHEACLEHGTLPVRYLPEIVGDKLKASR